MLELQCFIGRPHQCSKNCSTKQKCSLIPNSLPLCWFFKKRGDVALEHDSVGMVGTGWGWTW